MTIDPAQFALTVAVPAVLTIVLCVRFWVSGSENLRSKLAAFVFLVGFVWILPLLYEKVRTDGSFGAPSKSTFVQTHALALNIVRIIVLGLVVYVSVVQDD